MLRRLPEPAQLALLLLVLTLPFLGKPVHIDDANFLALARGALADPWRPHGILVNWQGTMQPAFDVLSNPPGIGWLLAPVVGMPVWVQHLWMMPWLVLAALGAWRLGDRLSKGKGFAAAVLLCASPSAVLAAQSLMPDLPLLACVLLGLSGLAPRPGAPAAVHRWPWALVVGAAALFRYSGLAMVPLVVAWALLQRDRRAAVSWGLAAAVPTLGLWVHDLAAYGSVHFVAMMDFQDMDGGLRGSFRKLAAAVAMLGGALVLPVLCWVRPRLAWGGAVGGAALGGLAVWVSALQGGPAVMTVLACAAGGASLVGALDPRHRHGAFAALWMLGGLVFLVKLRFTAARYWLPFMAPAVLVPLATASPRLVRVALVLTPLLALGLASADARLAHAQDALAAKVIAQVPQGDRRVAGHWGWQHHLEAAGWTPLEDDAPVPVGTWIARSDIAWPQEPGPVCTENVATLSLGPGRPMLRVHSATAAVNIHAFVVSASPAPVETYAPWGIAADPWDTVTVDRVVACPSPAP